LHEPGDLIEGRSKVERSDGRKEAAAASAAARDPIGAVLEVISMSEEMVIRESEVRFSNPSDCPRSESNAERLHGVMCSSKTFLSAIYLIHEEFC
jgi:hypothetical protein